MGRLDDRVVIITGAAKHIGRAYAKRLGTEGAKLAICDVVDCGETVEIVRDTGAEVLSRRIDVTDEEQTQRLAREVMERYGRIDSLVNNAALFDGLHITKMEDVDMDEWDRTYAVNVKGTFLCCRAVVPYMKKAGGGKIVNIASGIFLSGVPGWPHYVSSKAAVMGLSRALAKELGDYNITVNTLSPGGTQSGAQFQRAEDAPEVRPRHRPLNRPAVPEDLTGTLVYLLSSDSDFVTGQMMVINGGDALH